MSTILVAEDDKAARRMAVSTLKKMGHIVFASPNGRHAYETLQVNEGIDLVLTDIMMPEMDGRQLIKKIREGTEFAAVPIIAMSVLFAEIAEDMQLSIVQIGAVWGMLSLAGAFVMPASGILGDRFGIKRVVAFSCCAGGIMVASIGVSIIGVSPMTIISSAGVSSINSGSLSPNHSARILYCCSSFNCSFLSWILSIP